MLQISPRAARIINSERDGHGVGPAGGMRMFLGSDEERARAVRLAFVSEPEPSDTVVEQHASRVFLAAEVAPLLSAYTLDTELLDGGPAERLVLR